MLEESLHKSALLPKVEGSIFGDHFLHEKSRSWLDIVLRQPRQHARGSSLTALTYSVLILSFLANTLLLHQKKTSQYRPDIGRSKFSGLGYDTPVEYKMHTDYTGGNMTLADHLWDDLDSSPIIVALTDSYAQEHGLDISARFPWDPEKGIYHVKAFHQLHCLKSMRKAYTDIQRGLPEVVPAEHYFHCLDTLRQDVMCLGDDTPMPTINAIHRIGDGQVRQCRNWEKLIEWTQKPERHACYRMIDDYRKVPHTLEQFAFCDDGSKYSSTVARYFEEHGHKNPYGD